MKNQLILGLFILCVGICSCGGDATSTQTRAGSLTNEGDSTSLPDGQKAGSMNLNDTGRQTLVADDIWLIAPKKQIGLVAANADEAEIIRAYGQENVARRGIGVGERQTVQATVIFPDKPDELIVLWKESALFEQIAEVRIYSDSARWHSPEGLQVGMKLSQLRLINGKPFSFYGFEWDYAGLVDNWNGGNISDDVHVYLIPDNPEAVLPYLLGENKFSIEVPEAKQAGLFIGSMAYIYSDRSSFE